MAYARAVVALRFVLVLGWIAAAVAATLLLPELGARSRDTVDSFVSREDPHLQTEIASIETFGFPLLTRTVVVQHDPDGLPQEVQEAAVRRAVDLREGRIEAPAPVVGALPLVNTGALPQDVPGAELSEGAGTTALTFLYTEPASFAEATAGAQRFAAEQLTAPEDGYVGVTGSIPARLEQRRVIEGAIAPLHIATLGAVSVVVAVAFRSVVAPLVTIGTAALSFAIVVRVGAWLGDRFEVVVPSELEPLILALVLGVVTDYAVFFLAGTQHGLRLGAGRLTAARDATADFASIVTVAGLTVAAGTAALLAAEGAFFRAFGPGLAFAVLVSVVVSVTLVPALLAILGRVAFWPARLPSSRHPKQPPDPELVLPVRSRQPSGRGVRFLTRRPVAALVSVALVAGLVLLALPLRDLRLGVGFVPSLPEDSEAKVAAEAAQAGFADGILAPTELLLRGEGVADDPEALRRLAERVDAVPGVAAVLGAGMLPDEVEVGTVRTEAGDAARWFVVLEDDPLGATAIETFRRVEDALPRVVAEAGIDGATAGLAGDTAIAESMVSLLTADMARIIGAALLINLLMLALFLRALVAPLYLLLTSVLAVCASLGLATFLFQDVLGHDGLTFYVPFAAAVLLVALGSDYNIFGVGHVWHVARMMPLRAAVVDAVPRTARAINIAAVTLAATFGLLAVVPLRPFRELAFVLAVGIVLDAVVIRTLLVPALLVLFGRANWWPARAPRGDEELAVDGYDLARPAWAGRPIRPGDHGGALVPDGVLSAPVRPGDPLPRKE